MAIDEMKRAGLIISYYLSRCNYKAVESLGYRTFSEAIKDIGERLGEKPSNIKNMRDEFDPYFDNGRRGWYQRELRGSRQEIFDELSNYTDLELDEKVKEILGMKRGNKYIPENKEILKDLGALIRQSTFHYNQEFVWQDVELTNEFKDAYKGYLDNRDWDIQFFDSTAVITSPSSKYIFVPNQWFVIASYAVGVFTELNRYKALFTRVADARHERIDSYARILRDETNTVDMVAFLEAGKKIFLSDFNEEKSADRASKRLWRFATDYSWWSGQKTIDRNDFYLSVVLNMLNLVNASQGYVGEIVNAYGSDDNLMEITKKLSRITKNMDGDTYDIVIKPETTAKEIDASVESVVESAKLPPRIKISAKSIQKLGEKK